MKMARYLILAFVCLFAARAFAILPKEGKTTFWDSTANCTSGGQNSTNYGCHREGKLDLEGLLEQMKGNQKRACPPSELPADFRALISGGSLFPAGYTQGKASAQSPFPSFPVGSNRSQVIFGGPVLPKGEKLQIADCPISC